MSSLHFTNLTTKMAGKRKQYHVTCGSCAQSIPSVRSTKYQVVTESQEQEPLRMTSMPSEPWKDVAVDFWSPSHTGEYLLVKVCKQSR